MATIVSKTATHATPRGCGSPVVALARNSTPWSVPTANSTASKKRASTAGPGEPCGLPRDAHQALTSRCASVTSSQSATGPERTALRAARRWRVADEDGVLQDARRVAPAEPRDAFLDELPVEAQRPRRVGGDDQGAHADGPARQHGGRQRRPRTFEPGVRAVRLPPVIREPDRSAGRPGLRAGVVQLEDGGRRFAARDRGWRVDRLEARREARGRRHLAERSAGQRGDRAGGDRRDAPRGAHRRDEPMA